MCVCVCVCVCARARARAFFPAQNQAPRVEGSMLWPTHNAKVALRVTVQTAVYHRHPAQMSITNAVQLFSFSELTILPLNNDNNTSCHYAPNFKTECALLKYNWRDLPHRKWGILWKIPYVCSVKLLSHAVLTFSWGYLPKEDSTDF